MDPFVGQLTLVGFNFAPTGWAIAAGQLLPISQNTALFSLLGTQYGGDGKSNFALPNLQGSVAIGQGQGNGLSDYIIGQSAGEQFVTLLTTEVPLHTHNLLGANAGGQSQATNNAWGNSVATGPIYSNSTNPATTMSPNAVSTFGSSQPHNNMMPSVALLWIIAMQGVFPPRS